VERFVRALSAWKGGADLMTLDLTGARIGDAGLERLCTALVETKRPSLTALCLSENFLTDESAALLVNTINYSLKRPDRPTLYHLDLGTNSLGLSTGQALADYLRDDDCELAVLGLGNAGMGDDAVNLVIDVLCPPEFHDLTRVQASINKIGAVDRRYVDPESVSKDGKPRYGLRREASVKRLKLANNTLTALDLSSNGLGERTYHRLKHMARDNRVISILNLSGNPQASEECEEQLEFYRYWAIYYPELLTLNISRCNFEDHILEAAIQALGEENCRLTRLDASFNHFSAAMVESFAQALEGRVRLAVITGNNLRSLDLSANPVGTRGAVALAQALMVGTRRARSNEIFNERGLPQLTDLALSGCRIGPNGVSASRARGWAERENRGQGV
jgi:hypothetical protein